MPNYKQLIFCLGVSLGCLSFGQKTLEVSSSLDFQSTFISNEFYNSVLTTGFIGDDAINSTLNNSGISNRALLDFNNSLSYTVPKTDSLSYEFYGKTRALSWATIDEDLFSLVLNGNSQFTGDTAFFPYTTLNTLQYEQIGFNINKVIDSSNKVSYGLALVKSGLLNSEGVFGGELFTEEDGKYIDLSGSYSSRRTSSGSSNALTAVQGLGLAGNYSTERSQGGYTFRLDVRDLGFVYYPNVIVEDTSIDLHFDGVTIDNVFDGSSSSDGISLDFDEDLNLDLAGIQSSKKGVLYVLPCYVGISAERSYTERFAVKGQMYRYFLPGYHYRFSLRTTYSFPAVKLDFYLEQLAGGYSNYDVVLGLKKDFGDWATLKLQANYIESLILPKNSTSQSYNLVFASYF